MRIDRTRKHATVHGERVKGDPDEGVFYKQDGLPFDVNGLVMTNHLTAEQRAQVEAKLAALELEKARAEGVEPEEVAPTKAQAGDVNLEAWLRGETRYQTFKLTKAIKTRFSVNKTYVRDMVEYLVFEKKLVPFDELADDLRAKVEA